MEEVVSHWEGNLTRKRQKSRRKRMMKRGKVGYHMRQEGGDPEMEGEAERTDAISRAYSLIMSLYFKE